MKKIFYNNIIIFLVASVVLVSSCSKILDQSNLNSYSSTQIWDDANLANAYLINLYSIFGNYNVSLDGLSDQQSGISFAANAVTTTNGGGALAGLANWSDSYTNIRLINQGISSVRTGTLPLTTQNEILGQLYFMRAYVYFSLVTTYGGIPYIKVAQSVSDSLNVPRNSTKECFDYLIQDLDSALTYLPTHILSSSSDYGKIDGNFAIAFKGKVLLYKASPQFNPSTPWDNVYWADAYSANHLAYDSLQQQGYQLISDYSQVAINSGNTEVVFCVINMSPNKTSNWESTTRPASLSRGNPYSCPTWEIVKAFPMVDGKSYNDPSGKFYQTDNGFAQNFWQNRDPRFGKSVLYNAELYPAAGTPSGYRQYTSLGIANTLDAYGINPNAGIPAASNNNTYTGFFILKNGDLNLSQSQVTNYDVNYNVMRFAEVMLNYAEAANETGHSSEALDVLYQIRKRAGIEAGTDEHYGIVATSRTEIRQAIMNERNIELCFEGFRFKDLRRWRMFNVLNGVAKHGMESIAINSDGSQMAMTQAQQLATTYQLLTSNFQYLSRQVPMTGVLLNTLPDSYYFAPIQQSVIAAGNKLEQNTDWGGSFVPTIN